MGVAQQKKYVERLSRTKMVSSAQERKLKDSILKTHLSEKEDIFLSPTIVQNFAEKKKEKFCAQLMKTKMDANQKPNMMRTTDDNGDWCPSHSVCQKQCPKGFLLCEYETVDSKGCKVEPSCIYKGKNNNDLYCAGHCPPICSGGETLVSPGYDADGCELPSLCEVSA